MPRLPPVTSAVRPASEIIDRAGRLDQLDDEMLEREMEELDLPGVVGRHHQGLVHFPRQRPAVSAQKGHGRRAEGTGGSCRRHQIGTPAARAVQHQQVARPAERFDLAGKDLLEAEVVPGGREQRGVGGERHGGQRTAGGGVAHHVLGSHVLRVGGAAAVAAEEQRAAAPQHRRRSGAAIRATCGASALEAPASAARRSSPASTWAALTLRRRAVGGGAASRCGGS